MTTFAMGKKSDKTHSEDSIQTIYTSSDHIENACKFLKRPVKNNRSCRRYPPLWQAVLLFIKQNRYLIYYIRYLI